MRTRDPKEPVAPIPAEWRETVADILHPMNAKQPPVPGWEPIRAVAKVVIPTADGERVAYTLDHEVDAWRDPETGETYFDGDAVEAVDRVKARHMGLLAPEEIRGLRRSLGLTQRELSGLLQIGEKSWTRWETGRERPSRSMNVLLRALKDGRVDVEYLRSLRTPRPPAVTESAYAPCPAPALMVYEPAAAPATPVSASRRRASRALVSRPRREAE